MRLRTRWLLFLRQRLAFWGILFGCFLSFFLSFLEGDGEGRKIITLFISFTARRAECIFCLGEEIRRFTNTC